MKIYTKTGDKGQTSLIGGIRVPKHHIRIDAYGTVDELNSHAGFLCSFEMDVHYRQTLILIQHKLFTIGALLASEPKKTKSKISTKISGLSQEDVELLEKEIDKIEETLPPLRSFIIPGGAPAVSACHITRCVCRRAERLITHLAEQSFVDEIIITYLNRLSDYLFVLSRKLTYDLKAEEQLWKGIKG